MKMYPVFALHPFRFVTVVVYVNLSTVLEIPMLVASDVRKRLAKRWPR